MKVYEAVYKEGVEGIYALSVVENPAMEDLWITLSEHPKEIQFAAVDEEKRLLLGAALIPNKKIYRNIDGNEFYITFKEETIEKLWHEFFKNQNNNNSSLEHEIKLEGMSVVEGWIVEDSEKDKSALYGKSYEKGTAVAMMKVDNDEMWQKAKNGEIKGFSIDALLGLQELKLNKSDMNEEVKKSIVTEVLDGVKALFNTNKEEEPKEIEQIEVQTEEVVEEVKEPTFDAEAFARELKETLSVEFKTQLTELEKAKDKEIEDLKAELAKTPEVEPIKSNPETKKVELNKGDSIYARVFNNLSQNLW